MANDTDSPTLTARQFNAISALMTQPSVRSAAKEAGIAERTIWRWMKEPAFRAEYDLAMREAVVQTKAIIRQYSGAMAREMVRLSLNARSEAVRERACKDGLDLVFRITEMEEMQRRLEALEQAYATKL